MRVRLREVNKKMVQYPATRYSNYQNLGAVQWELDTFGRGVQPAPGDLERRKWENTYLSVTLLLLAHWSLASISHKLNWTRRHKGQSDLLLQSIKGSLPGHRVSWTEWNVGAKTKCLVHSATQAGTVWNLVGQHGRGKIMKLLKLLPRSGDRLTFHWPMKTTWPNLTSKDASGDGAEVTMGGV